MAWNDISDISYLWNPSVKQPEEGILTSFVKGYVGASTARKDRIASETINASKAAETGTGEGSGAVNKGFAFEDMAKGVMGYGTGNQYDRSVLYRKADELRTQEINNSAASLLLKKQQQNLAQQVANQNAAGSVEIGNIMSTVNDYESGWMDPDFQEKLYGAMAKYPAIAKTGVGKMAQEMIQNAAIMQRQAEQAAQRRKQSEESNVAKGDLELLKAENRSALQEELYKSKTDLEQRKSESKNAKPTAAEINNDPDLLAYKSALAEINSPSTDMKPEDRAAARARAKRNYEMAIANKKSKPEPAQGVSANAQTAQQPPKTETQYDTGKIYNSGDIRMKYLGGDPKNPKSWEVQEK